MTVRTNSLLQISLWMLAVLHCNVQASYLEATCKMNGHKATVKLTPTANDSIIVHLKAMSDYGIDIYELPVVYDVADKCGNLGNKLASFGIIVQSQNTTKTGFLLFNSSVGLAGSSVVLLKGGQKVACGTIQGQYPLTSIATFRGQAEIAGEVVFRQLARDSSNLMTMTTDLFMTAPKTPPSDLSLTMGSSCSSAGSNYVSKLAIGTVKGTEKKIVKFFNDATISFQSISGGFIMISSQSQGMVACIQVNTVVPRKVKAHVSMSGVVGTATFEQQSPFEPTIFTYHFKGVRSATTYHIHDLPVPYHYSKGEAMCSSYSVSGHWNPYNIDIKTSPKNGTHDQFEVGDLSGKFGPFDGTEEKTLSAVDDNLPLFGVNSIVGRSFVIHNSSARIACGTVGYPGPVVTQTVRFKYPIIGSIVMRQLADDPLSDTTIFTELMHSDGKSRSVNHNIHVHEIPYSSDFMADTGRCASVKGHFNPENVDLNMTNGYNECGSRNQLRCEVGDLSGKHGPLSIGEDGMYARAFFTSVYLPLSGPQNTSIAGRSITIHAANAGGARYSCANIERLYPAYGIATNWSESEVQGTIKFEERNDGNVDLMNNLTNLRGIAKNYHVHLWPIKTVGLACSPSSVGGHFNPFGIDFANSPTPSTGSADQYEVGDLSGKHQPLVGQNTENIEKVDLNLFLSGIHGIIGRSIVVHKDDETNSRWDCANIVFDTEKMSGKAVTAMATFKGSFTGFIKFDQVIFPDGTHSDTIVTIDVSYTEPFTNGTMGHNWHVHVKPVGKDAEDSVCGSCGPHYNPFKAPISDDRYKSHCNMHNPSYCELGDMSGRLGTYDVGDGVRVYTDVDLPLTGNFSVLGRSVVIHAKEKGAPRVACADIIPIKGRTIAELSFPDSVSFDKLAIKDKILNALSANSWDVVVEMDPARQEENCVNTLVYFSGENMNMMKTKFEQIKATELDIFSHDASLCGFSNKKDPSGTKASTSALSLLSMSLLICWSLH